MGFQNELKINTADVLSKVKQIKYVYFNSNFSVYDWL
jgi:hypothetical protein